MGDERSRALRRGGLVVLVVAAAAGCGDPPPGRTFYQRNIEPILLQKCAGNTSGCHSTNTGDPFQFAAGNFDVSSFANVQKRRDVLAPFGAYAYPLVLIKAVPTGALPLYYDTKVAGINPMVSPSRPLEVQHSGGPILNVNSDAFITLQNWLQNGATENGLKPPTPPQVGSGSCSDSIPPGFTKATFVTPTTQPSFDAFKLTVQPILTRHGCNAGSCHGAPQSDFYITCGSNDDELAFNFSQAWSFVNNPVEDSQILRIPLAVGAGGRGHTGGDQFSGTDDADYKAIKTWAMQIGVLDFAKGDPARQFFASYVQPILLARGCSFQACHSPGATNDFKLRSGTQGFFSAVALEKNYELLKNEFMAVEFPDARRGRAVSKALVSNGDTASGITHRGGPILEDPAHTGPCTFDPLNPQNSSPLCAIQTWLTLERTTGLAGQVTVMDPGSPATIVFVQRSNAALDGDRLSFDTFAGGAELRRADTTFAANQALTAPVAATTAIAASCGLAGGDIRTPDVALDGDHVVFAGRASAADALGVYMVKLSDPTACVHVTMPAPDSNGLKVHNFSPAFSPDGNWIVFASTRGKPGVGATRSRRRFLPQSDLWRVKVDLGTDAVDQGSYEQITFLSNSEVSPHFMREGRITMTTEKASDGFYQLSGRRINWDRTDYHPLLAQRATSPYASLTDLTQTKPSIGYASATDIREGSDGNFLVILSDLGSDGAAVAPGGGGALGVFNRSIGPFEQGRSDTGYIPALRLVNGDTATGRAGAAASYRNPVSLPSGEIMVSYASSAATGNFEVVAVNPHSGAQTTLIPSPASTANVDAVLAYKYPPRALYDNRRQLVFGGSDSGDPAHAVLHMPDAPMVFTLLTGNLRRGRPVDAFRKARFLAVYSEGMCPAGSCSANTNGIFQSRTLLGRAPLADDGSVRVQLPSGTGVVLELQDDKQASVVTMGEEHQLGPGEQISMGISQTLFDAVCAGCHGSVTGHEVDVEVSADALTGASSSISAGKAPATIGP
jgi:hypothetical protein